MLARPALVVPESRALEDLLLDMRQQRQHVAIVVDEYGGVSGIAALEDVLEELIGEFEDESDARDRRVPRRRADGALLVPGALRPDELENRTGLKLPQGDWETVAGYMLAQLGRLAKVGDAVPVGEEALEVTSMSGNRIVELAVRRGRPGR
jgi:CBS domain containing-hemolysin-like protein